MFSTMVDVFDNLEWFGFTSNECNTVPGGLSITYDTRTHCSSWTRQCTCHNAHKSTHTMRIYRGEGKERNNHRECYKSGNVGKTEDAGRRKVKNGELADENHCGQQTLHGREQFLHARGYDRSWSNTSYIQLFLSQIARVHKLYLFVVISFSHKS